MAFCSDFLEEEDNNNSNSSNKEEEVSREKAQISVPA